MSDFNNPDDFDKYGNPTPFYTKVYGPSESTGRAPYVLLGLLVAIGIIGGALYFQGAPNSANRSADVANAPPAAERSMTPTPMPAPSTAPDPTTATPAPGKMQE